MGELRAHAIRPTNPTLTWYRLTLILDTSQGRVNSALRLLAFASIPLGRAAGGLLLEPVGPRV